MCYSNKEDSVMVNSDKILFWTPRILAIAAILFTSLFALDAFEHGENVWQKLAAFVMHLVPSIVLTVILLVAWKWEMIGGAIFLLIGMGFSPIIFIHNYRMNGSYSATLVITGIITFPFILVGLLFILDYYKHRASSSV